ncbi:MAG: hypothetical protein NVSMB5_06990 [Candidatus Velthaea sp.]
MSSYKDILMNLRLLMVAGALAGTLAGSGVANAQMYPGNNGPMIRQPHRGEFRSAANLANVRRRLERLIDQLQHDQRDYGGHRLQAIQNLQAARAQLDAALQFDTTHPH